MVASSRECNSVVTLTQVGTACKLPRMVNILYALLLAVGAATELDLAWEHDAGRLVVMSLVLVGVWCLRRDLTRSEA